MLTNYQRAYKNRLIKKKPTDWDLVLYIYKNANYTEGCVFRREVESLTTTYDKIGGFMLMDEIDRIYEHKLGNDKLQESVKKMCALLKVLPDKYKLYY